jgi:hypothetical protein
MHRGAEEIHVIGWLRSLGATGRRTPQSAQARVVEELEIELSLLREENTRLKLKHQRARDRPVHERVHELLPHRAEGAADGEPWELLADCWRLREDLTDACREIERSVRATRKRLESLEREREATADQTTRDSLEHVA